MANIVLSVMSTGTRTTMQFIDWLGVVVDQIHAEPQEIDCLLSMPSPKFIIPYRDPLHCWCSWYIRDGANKKHIKKVTDEYSTSWDVMALIKKRKDAEFHPIDVLKAIKDKSELKNAAKFFGCTKDTADYIWKPLGVSAEEPSNNDVWRVLSAGFTNEQKDYVYGAAKKAKKTYANI